MNITYKSHIHNDVVTVTSAICQVPLFGRWTEFGITSYCLNDDSHRSTAITFGLRPLSDRELKCSNLSGASNGMIILRRGSGGNKQEFEQKINVPNIIGQLLDYSDLTDGGVQAARVVTDSILRRIESIIETIRQNIRRQTSTDKDVRDLLLNTLHARFSEVTSNNIKAILGQINWGLLLRCAGCDDEQLRVINYATAHNPPRFHSILEDSSTEIPLISAVPLNRFDRTTVANIKAVALLRNVCGPELALEFENSNKITVKHAGYTFVLSPRDFVKCTDPNGKNARLCIHTVGFSCNPVDELVIAYLHIKHNLAEYMEEAILQGSDPGFQKKVA